MAEPQLVEIAEKTGEHFLNSFVVTIFLSLIAIVTLYEYWFRNQRHVKLANQIPGPRTLPIIGNAHWAIGKSPADLLESGLGYYKGLKADVARVWFGSRLYVVIGNAEDAEVVLGSTDHLEKAPEYGLFGPWLGDGLLISSGEKWKSHRKIIAPTFHSTILKSFMPVFNKNANNLVIQLQKEKGKIFDCQHYMSNATVDTLLETVMGVDKTHDENKGYEFVMAVMGMCNILHLRQLKVWLRPNIIFKFTKLSSLQTSLLNVIHDLTNKVIQRKKENYFERQSKGESTLYTHAVKSTSFDEPNGQIIENSHTKSYIKDDLDENEENDIGDKKRLAFLDFMIEASQNKNNNLSDEEISEEVNTIMFAGHDAIAAASSFVLCLLGIHTDVQKRVLEELEEIFQNDMNRPITYNDTIRMKYFERVILESLRMYPPVPFIGRKASKDVKLASGDYTIPGGTSMVVAQILIHRNEKYWKNPFKFDPDNFLPENCQQRPFYSFMPFSGGPRSCVGRKYAMLKLKVLLAGVLRKFEIVSLEKEIDFKLQADVILKREDGFKIKVVERV